MNKKLKYFGIPQIISYVKKYRLMIVVMVVLGALSSLIDTIYPLFNQYAINHYIGQGKVDNLTLFIVSYILFLIAQVFLNYFSSYLCCKVELEVGRDLKNASFNHLQTLSFSYFNTNNVGYVHARIMSDTDRIGTMVSWRLMDIVWNLSYIIFVFVVMSMINVRLALLLLLLVPVAIVFILFFQKRIVFLNRKIREINSMITGHFNEGITGAKTIRTLVVEDTIQDDFEKDTNLMKRTSIHSTHYSALFSATVTTLSSVALAIVLWQGGRLSIEGLMKIGTLSVFMSYALGMIDPIQRMIETISQLINVQVNIERFTTLMNTDSDVVDGEDVIKKYGDVFHPRKENWEKLHGDIVFENVSFKYPDGEEMVLEDFNLHVPQGTNVAIVGETGAGKSTLVNLVCRFYEPTKGRILIDGRDARERSQSWLHDHIGYVLQTPHLFSGTIRDNLRYGKSDATDEEIWKALKIVNAEEIVKRMGDGLDSNIGEGGNTMSTGEKQLLSFARAIIANPAILILDEATSSIDTMTEQKIQMAIEKLVEGRTSFMIAHRLSTVVNADIILVVKDGKIIESGQHEELMNKKGYYYQLYSREEVDQAIKKAF